MNIQRFFSIIIIGIVCMNLSKQQSSPQYCSGIIIKNKEAQEPIVDIKIGTSVGSSDNKNIRFYRKTTDHTKKPQDYIEFDLDSISKITVDQQNAITKYDNKEYINVTITNKAGNVTTDCIIPRDMHIIAKAHKTGWTVTHHFDTIDTVIIHGCAPIEAPLVEATSATKEKD